MKRYVTIPRMGKEYTNAFKQTFENLGLNVRLPPKTTDKTIQIGVRNTAEMVCFPLKPTLGNFVEALDEGANTLLMYDSMGQCREKHYAKIQELALREMGYNNFEMYNINSKNALTILNKLSGKSKTKIFKELFNFYKKIKVIDEEKERWSTDKSNIGIVGEIYTCCDEKINYGIEDKIKKLGANPVNTVTLSCFIKENLIRKFPYLIKNKRKKYDVEANKYFNGVLGGHGRENVSHLLELIDNKVDGVLHLLPMSCCPEVTIEPFVNKICRENKTPLLRIPIDENTSPANLETRLETFIELIRMRGGI